MYKNTTKSLALLALLALTIASGSFIMIAQGAPAREDTPGWLHLSTAYGDLPSPSSSSQQVLSLIADIDNDGVNDFVIGTRRGGGPALVWYRREAAGWTRHVIENDSLQLEAGGAYHDIDGDGDQDVVAGANAQGNEIWWWENP